MAKAKKPGDETIRTEPVFDGEATGLPDEPKTDRHDRPTETQVAPEVSQGLWRDRSSKPRRVMPPEHIVFSLEGSLRTILGNANLPRIALEQLRTAWLPALRQAVEQAGGDGVDAWLRRILKSRVAVSGLDPFYGELVHGIARLRLAKDLAGFEQNALKVLAAVRRALLAEAPAPISFKLMEGELEGKLDLDQLLAIAFADDGELARRLDEIQKAMAALRDQLKSIPGRQPQGMYTNFVRMKVEVRVIAAEQADRLTRTQEHERLSEG